MLLKNSALLQRRSWSYLTPSVLAAGTVAAILAGVAFSILAARSLGAVEYANFAVSMIVVGWVAIASQGVQNAATREAAVGTGNRLDRKVFDAGTLRVTREACLISVPFVVLLWLIQQALMPAINALPLAALTVLPSVLLAAFFGKLIAAGRYKLWQGVSLLGLVLKLMLGMIAVSLVDTASGLIAAIILSGALTFLLAFAIRPRGSLAGLSLKSRAVWGAMALSVVLWGNGQVDVLFAPIALPSSETTTYIAASAAVKPALLVAAVFGGLALPLVARADSRRSSSLRRTLMIASLAGGVGVVFALLVSSFGEPLLRYLFNDPDLVLQPTLTAMSWASVPWICALCVANAKSATDSMTALAGVLGLQLILTAGTLMVVGASLFVYNGVVALSGVVALGLSVLWPSRNSGLNEHIPQ